MTADQGERGGSRLAPAVENIGAYGQPGEVTLVRVYSRDLGPRGFVGYEVSGE